MKLKTLVGVLALAMLFNVGVIVHAEDAVVTSDESSIVSATEDINKDKDIDKQKGREKFNEKIKDVKEKLADKVKESKKDLENVKEKGQKLVSLLERKIKFLEAKLELVKNSGAEDVDTKIQEITALIDKTKAQIETVKAKVSEQKEKMAAKVKEEYTAEELATIQAAADILKEHKDLKVLKVENVFAKGKNIKFDLPPVIKEGRTLIPIRALSEAYGFDVKWDADAKKITISKDGKTIELYVDKNEAYVNGEKIDLDVAPTMYKVNNQNARTVVPLRFIVEKMGLNINWDEKTETIDIDDDKDAEEVKDEDVTDMTEDEINEELEEVDSEVTEETTAPVDTSSTSSDVSAPSDTNTTSSDATTEQQTGSTSSEVQQ